MRLDAVALLGHVCGRMETGLTPISERKAAGRAHRNVVSRKSQAVWSIPRHRLDPVATLEAHASGRMPELQAFRYGRMKSHAYAFLRGAGAIMAADLASMPSSGLHVQICGDAHVGNFGAVPAASGEVLLDIIDFDETVTAPFEWDVKRLAVSVVVALRARGADPRFLHGLAKEVAAGYREEMHRLAEAEPLSVWRGHVPLGQAIAGIEDPELRAREERMMLNQAAATRDGYAHMIERRGSEMSLIEWPPRLYRLPGREDEARALFEAYLARLGPDRQALLRRYVLRDVAFKGVGLGSLGAFCAIGLFGDADGHHLLLQLKQAEPPTHATQDGQDPVHDGMRVVDGQRLLQGEPDPFLEPLEIGGQPFYVRQLRDPRLAKSGTHLPSDAIGFQSWLCGRTLAVAHARSGDAAMIAGYLGRSETFDEAIAQFARSYADQVERDYAYFLAAVQDGAIEARRVRRSA